MCNYARVHWCVCMCMVPLSSLYAKHQWNPLKDTEHQMQRQTHLTGAMQQGSILYAPSDVAV